MIGLGKLLVCIICLDLMKGLKIERKYKPYNGGTRGGFKKGEEAVLLEETGVT